MSQKKPIKVAIASQKGGGGKSTITMLLANKLYFERKKKVLIVDCDIPQNSCAGIRQDELSKLGTISEKLRKVNDGEENADIITNDEKTLWKLFEKSYQQHPDVKEEFAIEVPKVQGNALEEISKQISVYEKREVDVILFDTVGSISNKAYLELMKQMDFIFVPIETEESALKPAISSLNAFKNFPGVSVYGFFNKFKLAETEQKKCMFSVLAIALKLNLPLMTINDQPLYMEDKACFRSPLVKSSLFPAIEIKAYKSSEGNNLISTMCKTILRK